jgi:hypothetical protein
MRWQGDRPERVRFLHPKDFDEAKAFLCGAPLDIRKIEV